MTITPAQGFGSQASHNRDKRRSSSPTSRSSDPQIWKSNLARAYFSYNDAQIHKKLHLITTNESLASSGRNLKQILNTPHSYSRDFSPYEYGRIVSDIFLPATDFSDAPWPYHVFKLGLCFSALEITLGAMYVLGNCDEPRVLGCYNA